MNVPDKRAIGFFGDDIDYAAQRIRAVNGRLRSANKLDTFDLVDIEACKINVVVGSFAADPLPVDQEQHIFAVYALIFNLRHPAHAVVGNL